MTALLEPTEAKKSLAQLLDDAAAHEFRTTASALDNLRERIGRDDLSTDEWNALIGSACYLRVDADRRDRQSSAPQEPDDDALTKALKGIERIAEKHTGISGSRSLQTAMHAIAFAARGALQAKAPGWHPHLDYAGEPMKPGEFRDRPEAPKTGEG